MNKTQLRRLVYGLAACGCSDAVILAAQANPDMMRTSPLPARRSSQTLLLLLLVLAVGKGAGATLLAHCAVLAPRMPCLMSCGSCSLID